MERVAQKPTFRMVDERRKGRKITLVRNGNKDFKGNIVVVSEKRYPKFELLMDEVSKMKVSRIPDTIATSLLGTRYIYSEDGQLITSVQQFQDGKKYICCATPYLKSSLVPWRGSVEMAKLESSDSKTIFVVLAGNRPRTIACLLLMKKFDISFSKLLSSVGDFLNINPEKIDSIVTTDNVKVTTVSQFLDERNSIFIVFMTSKRHPDELMLSTQEMEFIKSTLLSQQKE